MAGRRDVVIIGSGHNALVAACYLAREGLDVEIVERDTVLGGAVSTVERWPGYLVDRGSSAHVMFRHTAIAEELDLASTGLRYLDMDPWAYAPFAEGSLTFWRDLDRTCDSITALCGEPDADAYRRFAIDWMARNRAVFAAFQDRPTAGRLGRHLWGAGRSSGIGGLEMSRQFLQPADQLLDETFDDERLKTALAWLGSQSGPPPHESGTADLVGWAMTMHQLPPGRPVGGSGALTQALAERLRLTGGSIRLGDGAVAITKASDRVTGVRTLSGETIAARAVLAGCHVLTTIDLLDDETLSARARAVRVGNGIGIAVRFATDALPAYAGADTSAYAGMQLLTTSRTQLRRAYGDYIGGRPPSEPAVLLMTPTALDPSLAPPGRHTVTAWAQWYPYELAAGETWHEQRRDEVGDAVVAEVERAAPGFGASIEHRLVQTPVDLERELGLLRGNVMHVEMTLDAMFAYRPLPELAGYRTPVRGLYLTGASTHPGGGVFGASGRSAARLMMGDRRRWR